VRLSPADADVGPALASFSARRFGAGGVREETRGVTEKSIDGGDEERNDTEVAELRQKVGSRETAHEFTAITK
jgi:hypothetical protein